MSVVVITTFSAQAANLEAVLDKHGATLEQISADGRSKGALHHMFVEGPDGNLMVIDEWDSKASFDAFFAAQQDIRTVMGDVGVTGPPASTEYRILDTPDRF